MEMTRPPMTPLFERAIPAAVELIEHENFSIENLCHSVDCSLKDLVDAIGSVDDLIVHVNDRFMSVYVEKASVLERDAKDDVEALYLLSLGWLDHALAHPQMMNTLLQHKWADGFVRPDWYMARVASCFAPIELRLMKLAPGASLEVIRGVARGLYAHICGLYFLAINERDKPAGITGTRKLMQLFVATLAKGLK